MNTQEENSFEAIIEDGRWIFAYLGRGIEKCTEPSKSASVYLNFPPLREPSNEYRRRLGGGGGGGRKEYLIRLNSQDNLE